MINLLFKALFVEFTEEIAGAFLYFIGRYGFIFGVISTPNITDNNNDDGDDDEGNKNPGLWFFLYWIVEHSHDELSNYPSSIPTGQWSEP